ncbi:ribonuclease domain-containing protein [Burkholderia sp. PAMC 28687]|uniref:ribonuclease domain-containing protein n=1 Tax=Burkholderia sp. PAMC 28687 TaxID=1795874 RepID=UPI003FA43C5B
MVGNVADKYGFRLSVVENSVSNSSNSTRFVSNVEVVDQKTGRILSGTVDLQPTLQRIESGVSYPHRNDGSIFQNRPSMGSSNPALPVRPAGYYTEYVVPTHGVAGPGPQRIVIGRDGEAFYTPDHYQTFTPIRK